MEDKRFSRVAKDPRFKKTPLKERKLKIDSRFEKMFTDKSFTTKYFVDKRGSQVGKTSTEDLHKFYDLSEDETVDDNANAVLETEGNNKAGKERGKKSRSKSKVIEKKLKKKKKEKTKGKQEIIQEKDEIGWQDRKTEAKLARGLPGSSDSSGEDSGEDVDFARGEGNVASSDDDSDDAEDYSNYKQDEVEHPWGELHTAETKMTETATKRLAVCNLDWDRVTATDILVLFNSFRPREGLIHSVKIYPSDFGLERMKREDCYGPEELHDGEPDGDDSPDDVEGSGFSSEKLRQYQLNRLKYYYAVVECDSAETAEKLYDECDGVEFALSGNLVDLRFIPDDMEFEREPHSVATEMPDPATYAAPEFSTTALHQTNVKLTWDETDPKRTRTTMRKFNKDDILDMDFKAYLASSGDEDDDDEDDGDQEQDSADEEQQIRKYKELVEEIDGKERREGDENEMEITWEPGLQETAEDLVKRKLKEKSERELTPWETYQQQKKTKRKERKREKNEAGDEEDDVPAGVDMSDPFFNQEFGPEFEGGKSDERESSRKRKRKHKRAQEEGGEEGKKQKDELELLLMDEDDNRQHFSLRGIMDAEKKSKKRKKRGRETQAAQDNFEIDVGDSRFNALYTSHHFAVDPSHPQYKKTKAMATIMEERQKRRQRADKDEAQTKQKSTEHERVRDPSLSMLVKSVKSKTGQFQQKKKQKTQRP